MPGKQMEGDNRQRRGRARDARERGRQPSEESGTLGASQQRNKAAPNADHAEKLAQVREGKQKVIRENTPEPRPGSRR